MFKNKTYKQRFTYLAVGSILFVLFVFQVAIKKTLDLRCNCNNTIAKLEYVKNAPFEIGLIQKKILNLEELIGADISVKQSTQEIILEKSSKYCNNKKLVIKEFSMPHFYKNQDFLVETNIIAFEGSFINLLKLVYQFEQQFKVGKLTSVKFATYKDRKMKRINLTAKLFIQTIKKYESED